ncbi:NAD(P)-binding protein [Tilletiaria anomala UBC 951]|uniref:NAD(P)-binding protein n=1 Tax=Tilletiaria anomala (strain ATCC 24038 / CBS 436.72 / UBC 951) TaxID=1037660 RepID=A0A066VSE0_TILAU|nr:NAD(P)-binding protein [Tilletiaria anomala UBC 951]KDN43203.1 NAD(P)-binding protein [Tilletiaria anomala UBC 951]
MCARALAANGAKVYISGRRQAALESAAADCNPELAPLGGSLVPVQGDVSDKASLAKIAETIQKTDGRLHILVNNAGVEGPCTELTSPEGLSAKDISEAHLKNEEFVAWDKLFSINTHSVLFSTMSFLPLLSAGNAAPPSSRAQEKYAKWTAAVINITSISGFVKVSQSHYAYNASKAAANHITKMLAHELNFRSKLGIRVNAIAPGLFMTEMTAPTPAARVDPSQVGPTKHANPAGRFGTEEEMASLCLYLASNCFQQGQIVVLDGGFTTAVASTM